MTRRRKSGRKSDQQATGFEQDGAAHDFGADDGLNAEANEAEAVRAPKAVRDDPAAERDDQDPAVTGPADEARAPLTRAFVIHPKLSESARGGGPQRAAESRLREAEGLTAALGVAICGAEIAVVTAPKAGTLFGAAKRDELGARMAAASVDLAVVDHPLTPVQQRNLERDWGVKVLDRTGLILEIFGERAQTREGVLQVELAHYQYQKSRLVRSWTHLERQRGGVGFLGGPGETQLESDRRVLSEKIAAIKKRLEKSARTRAVHRAGRRRGRRPVVALVGYTNAGKSTLFNRLTGAGILAKDMLFATLDPTMRAVGAPGGREIILSDTVGFISDLPTQLVAAFRATLEEVVSADLIVHVRDVSDPETEAQKDDVINVLRTLGLQADALEAVLEARNKVDLLDAFDQEAERAAAARQGGAVCVSAATGEGVDALMREIERRVTTAAVTRTVDLGPTDGAAVAWLYARGLVLAREDDGARTRLTIRLTPTELGQFEKRFSVAAGATAAAAAE